MIKFNKKILKKKMMNPSIRLNHKVIINNLLMIKNKVKDRV